MNVNDDDGKKERDVCEDDDEEGGGDDDNPTEMAITTMPTATTKPQNAVKSSSKQRKPTKRFKKAPGAPKRFRSAFILFSQQKHKLIQEEMSTKRRKTMPNKEGGGGDNDDDDNDSQSGGKLATTSVAKLVSEAWRNLDAEEKRKWDAKATMDRERYEKEKMAYDGPWSVPIGHRQRKDASAPKRPASAFLAFSNSRRAAAKRDNKDASNAEISRILSKMWKEAPEEVRKIYQDEEATARAEYKIKIAEWRVEDKKNKDAERKDPLEIYEESGHIGAYGLPISRAVRGTKIKEKKSTRKKGVDSTLTSESSSKRGRPSSSTGVAEVALAGSATGRNNPVPMDISRLSSGLSASNVGLQSMMGFGSTMDRPIGLMPQNIDFPTFTHGLTAEQQLMLLRGTTASNVASMNFQNIGQGTGPLQYQGFVGANNQRGGDAMSRQSIFQNQLSQLSSLELMRLSQQHSFSGSGVGGGGMGAVGLGGNANVYARRHMGQLGPSANNRRPNS